MDPKLMAILKKAKAIDTVAEQKFGGGKKPSHDRDYFDAPEPQYLTSEQVNHGGIPTGKQTSSYSGGLYDQIGVSESSGGGHPVVDRLDVNSPMYSDSVKKSKLPEAIQKAMLETPIPQPSGLTDVSEDFIKELNPHMGVMNENTHRQPIMEVDYSEDDEKDIYAHPIQPQTKQREIPRTQPSPSQFNENQIRSFIAEEIYKALPKVIEDYFDKRVIKENVQFKAGDTTFSGTVSPLPKKRTK